MKEEPAKLPHPGGEHDRDGVFPGPPRRRILHRLSHVPCLTGRNDEAEDRVDSQRLPGMRPGQPHGVFRSAIDLGKIAAEGLLDLAIVCPGLEFLEESPTSILISLLDGRELLLGTHCFPS